VEKKVFLTVQSDYHKIKVPVDDILYVTIEGRKTKLTRTDGSAICTNRSLRDIYAELPEELFSNINRGIVVSNQYIKSEKGGVVTMKDGAEFRRRVRADRTPKKPKLTLQERPACPVEQLDPWIGPMPAPVCMLELVQRGRRGVQFVPRYMNRAMEALEQVKQETVTSLEQLPGAGSEKWLTIFADVAINGATRTAEDIWGETGRFFRVHCYQPQPGYCAMVLTELTSEMKLVQELFKK